MAASLISALKMIKRVNAKTGVNMDPSEVDLFWNMCRFENCKAPWCSTYPVCALADLRLFQYAEDLIKYYSYSYGGGQLKVHMTQPIWRDIFESFENFVNCS